jgi:acyl carrier protein
MAGRRMSESYIFFAFSSIDRGRRTADSPGRACEIEAVVGSARHRRRRPRRIVTDGALNAAGPGRAPGLAAGDAVGERLARVIEEVADRMGGGAADGAAVLMERGVRFDSIAMLALTVALEAEFGVRLGDGETRCRARRRDRSCARLAAAV